MRIRSGKCIRIFPRNKSRRTKRQSQHAGPGPFCFSKVAGRVWLSCSVSQEMKSEDDLLIELRDRMAAFAASKMTMQRVDARDFTLVDRRFYDRVAARLASNGFAHAGDFIPVTGLQSDGSMRCFIRTFLSS